MKPSSYFKGLGLIVLVSFGLSALGADQITLQLKKSTGQGEIGLHSQMTLPVSAMYPEYVIQQSTNLVNWTTVAGPFSGSVGVSDEFRRVAVPTPGTKAFYRVIANVKVAAGGSGIGDAIYGYGTAFGQQLRQLGQLSLEDFVSIYQPTNQYLPQVTFDPTTAEFWNLFSIDPAVWNVTNSFQNRRVFDFRLNPTELAVFQTNGFVVSQRLERRSFADVYYDLYTDDLPVFVTADSVLQAWHRSFVTMLAEIEDTCFRPTLVSLLNSMSAQVTTLSGQATGTALANGCWMRTSSLRSPVHSQTKPPNRVRSGNPRASTPRSRPSTPAGRLNSIFTANHGRLTSPSSPSAGTTPLPPHSPITSAP
jgi:hypothetical protein